jgi:hypothetical protein
MRTLHGAWNRDLGRRRRHDRRQSVDRKDRRRPGRQTLNTLTRQALDRRDLAEARRLLQACDELRWQLAELEAAHTEAVNELVVRRGRR